MTEWVEQQICIRFCIKLEHSSMETIQMIQKAAAMGNWWLAASSQQCASSTCLLMHHISCRVFLAKHQITQVTQPRYSPRFDALWLLFFPKTKITFKGEEISDCWWDSGKYDRAVDGNWENVWGPKVSTWKETEASLSYVQYFLYLLQYMSLVFILHG